VRTPASARHHLQGARPSCSAPSWASRAPSASPCAASGDRRIALRKPRLLPHRLRPHRRQPRPVRTGRSSKLVAPARRLRRPRHRHRQLRNGA